MPLRNTTVTRDELHTIERLNRLMKMKEERERCAISSRAVSHEPVHRGDALCDVCQKKLPNRICQNVVVDGGRAALIPGLPMADQAGKIVLRYHDDCYPRRLVQVMNAGPTQARGPNQEFPRGVDTLD